MGHSKRRKIKKNGKTNYLAPPSAVEKDVSNKEPETFHLLTIFPAEVWLLILNNVGEKEATHFHRICNASLYLSSLLQSRSVKVLFPKVMKILIEKQPKLFPNVALVLPLRKVCRNWKDGVDDAVQDLEFFYALEKNQNEVIGRNLYGSFESFRTVAQFQNFEQHFDPTHLTSGNGPKNPLLLRGIKLQMPAYGLQFDAYNQKCFEFLQKYGMHVWHCVVVRNLIDEMDHLKFYKVDLKRFLRLMRNLRSLYINDYAEHDFEGRYSDKLAASLAAAPLPLLPQLRKIGLGGGNAAPAPFLRALVTRNPEVQVFSGMVNGLNGSSSLEHVKMYTEEMPNLTRLSAQLVTQADFQAFCSAQQVNFLKLQQLHLFIGYDVKRTVWKKLFRTLEIHFSNSLTQLHLGFGATPPAGNWIPKGLTLPKLKQLVLQVQDPMPLDFILPMKDTLEELGVQLGISTWEDDADRFLQADEDAILKVWQFWEEPRKSNAWSLLPKLKKLNIDPATEEFTDIFFPTRYLML